jgi:hypothetical protein
MAIINRTVKKIFDINKETITSSVDIQNDLTTVCIRRPFANMTIVTIVDIYIAGNRNKETARKGEITGDCSFWNVAFFRPNLNNIFYLISDIKIVINVNECAEMT